MAIIYHPDWDMSEKGKKDVERHHKKIDDAIRKSVKDVVAEESIITKKKGKKVRIPVRGLKDYKFIHGQTGKGKNNGEDGDGDGVGQGKGKPGDVIGRAPKPGSGKGGEGKPGDQPGEDYIEAEIDIDYLIEIMFEDLGLPWIEEKTKAQQLVPSGWQFKTISKVGILPRLHKKRTILESIKRNELYAREIVEELNCNYEIALKALVQAKGDINSAIKLIKSDGVDKNIDPYVIIEDEDLRYKQIEREYELHSNAVVIAMMDTSGSMTIDKKYLCRSLLFWLVEFLKKIYDYVDIKFIVHTTEAKIVDEDTFFRRGESGGTFCWTAIDKSIYLIETEYPVEEWNVYCIYVSDGDDFDPQKTVRYVDELMKKKINMFAYTEVKPQYSSINQTTGLLWGSQNTLINNIKNKWSFNCKSEDGAEFCRNDQLHMILSTIRNKNHVYPTLKHILFKKEK